MKKILAVFAMVMICSKSNSVSAAASPSTPPTPSSSLGPIPNHFTYTCDNQGTLTIQKTNLPADVHVLVFNKSCSKLENKTSTFVFSNCTKNKTFTIAMDRETDSNLVGGKSLKLYDVKCESPVIKPYLVTAIMAGFTVKPATATHYAVNMEGLTTPSLLTPKDINMSMTDGGGNEITTVVIGQKLTIHIKEPAGYKIKPVSCKAKGNSNNHTLWTEDRNCDYDKELFGATWTEGSGFVKNTMYAFRFVGQSTHVDISCTVRVCPDGYNGTLCDISYCKASPTGRRKREAEDTGSLRLTKTETSIDVVNALQPASGAQDVLPNMATMWLLASALIMKLIY